MVCLSRPFVCLSRYLKNGSTDWLFFSNCWYESINVFFYFSFVCRFNNVYVNWRSLLLFFIHNGKWHQNVERSEFKGKTNFTKLIDLFNLLDQIRLLDAGPYACLCVLFVNMKTTKQNALERWNLVYVYYKPVWTVLVIHEIEKTPPLLVIYLHNSVLCPIIPVYTITFLIDIL